MDFKKKDAIYLQIGDKICENILTGRWPAGEKIPSVREMAVSIEVNPNTVMRAYAFLQEKNIIRNKRGIGYFVSDEGYDNTLELMRTDFIHYDLPRLFKGIQLLKIDFKELKKRYTEYERGENENQQ